MFPPAPTLNAKMRADLPFLGNVIAAHAAGLYSKNPLSVRVFSENPLEAWGVFAESWIPVFRKLWASETDVGRGMGKGDSGGFLSGAGRPDSVPGRGDQPWLLDRRDG